MTAALSLAAGRRSALDREELRRQLLALVLTFVLVWYTLVVPATGAARSYASLAPGDEGGDGEVRGAGGAARGEKEKPPTVEDLDWPEYIYPE